MKKAIYGIYNPDDENAVKLGFAQNIEDRLSAFSKAISGSYYIIIEFCVPDTISDSHVIHYIEKKHPDCRIIKKGTNNKPYPSEFINLEKISIKELIEELENFIEEHKIDTHLYVDSFFCDYIMTKSKEV